MITKKELQERIKKEAAGITDPAKLFQLVGDSLRYSAEHYDELDDEAKQMVDAQFDALKQMTDIAMETEKAKPDSISKREMLRMHRKAKGSHFDVKDLLQHLAEVPKEQKPMISAAREVFTFIAQRAYDYLSDVTDSHLKGGMEGLKLAMFYSALDEACVAMHLASRSYSLQSMGHTRHIIETTNLIVLFQKDSKYVDFWTSDDHSERWKVRPDAVRKILGKSSLDDHVYWLLSDLGTHPSFKYIQTKAKVKRGIESIAFKINVGAVPDTFHTQQALVACMTATMSLLNEVSKIYGHLLLKDEVERDLHAVKEKLEKFLATYTGFAKAVMPE